MGQMTIRVDDVLLVELRNLAERRGTNPEILAAEHRLHDCMYLALADRLQCPLLTADERLAGKAAAAKLSITVHLHTETPP